MVEGRRPGERWPPGPREAALLANYLSSFAIGLAIGGVIPFLTLVLERRGVEEIVVGANSAAGSLGIVALAPFVPRIVQRFGMAASVTGGLLVSTVALLLLGVFESLWAWFLLRPLVAGGTVIQWVVSETWMNAISTSRDRGRVMAVYVTAVAAGFAVGPVLLAVVGVDGWLPYLLFGAGILFSAAPMVAVARYAPPMRSREIATPLFLMRRAPTIFAAMIAVGIYAGGSFTFLPIYGLRGGLGQTDAVLVLTAFLAGNLLFQIPVGWLADRFNQRLLLIGCAVIGVVSPLMMILVFAGPLVGIGPTLLVLLAVWGGAIFGFYTIAITMLGGRFRGEDLALANAAFIMTFECANIAGPALTGAAMWIWSPHGMMGFLVFVAVFFIAVAAVRGLKPE